MPRRMGSSVVVLFGLIMLHWPGVAWAQGKSRPLHLITLNMGNADEAAVRKEAQRQTKPTVWPMFRSDPGKPPVFETFEGHFVPATNTTELAIFSDDGCNVAIEDVTAPKKAADIVNPVLKRLSVGQHLPSLDQSFHVLKLADKKGKKLSLQKGHIYHIRVDYSNTIHTDKKDVDGCTLFAYNGGGKVLPPGTKIGALRQLPENSPSKFAIAALRSTVPGQADQGQRWNSVR